MNAESVHDERAIARENIRKFIDVDLSLPNNVFMGAWDKFIFFPADEILEDKFLNIIKKLIYTDSSKVAVIINKSPHTNQNTIYVEATSKAEDFVDIMFGDGVSSGWIQDFDAFLASSSGGSFALYVERWNDIGVLALKDKVSSLYKSISEQLNGAEIVELLKRRDDAPPPFSFLENQWRDALVANYSAGIRNRN